jgi:hypothetical protein
MRGVKEQIRVNRVEEKRRQIEEKRQSDDHKRIMNIPVVTETKKVLNDGTPRSATSMSQQRPSSASSMSTVMTNLPGSLISYDPQFVSSKTSVLSKASSKASVNSRASSKMSLTKINATVPGWSQGRTREHTY